MKRFKKLLFLFIVSVAVTSCTYDFIKEETTPPIEPGTTIKFSTQIAPIFNDNSNCTACHKPGGQSPDFTTANAYNSIISNSLVSTSSPETSLLYTFPNPTTSTHTWKKYTANQAQLILLWIQQGALNN